jgi:hypothetical protein
MIEARSVFRRRRFHRAKAHLVLSAMRHRAAELGDRVRHVRADTYTHPAADRVGSLHDTDRQPGRQQVLCACETCRARADHQDVGRATVRGHRGTALPFGSAPAPAGRTRLTSRLLILPVVPARRTPRTARRRRRTPVQAAWSWAKGGPIGAAAMGTDG